MTNHGEEPPRTTAILPRNFTLTLEDRLRALAAGPPPFAVRLRRIEDLEASIVRALAAHEAKAAAPLDAATLPDTVRRDIERMNRLIDDHNRYYPIEANLPIDVRSSQLMDWGKPWAPSPPVSMEALFEKARAFGAWNAER